MGDSEFVTRRELDYRLDNTEQSLENKLDRILIALEAGFKRIDTDINWLKLIIVAIVLPLVVAVISLALPHLGK